MRVVKCLAAVAALVLTAGAVTASEESPPDQLAVIGSVFSWRDNTTSETGFEVSIMPIGGSGAPVFTHSIEANTTSFDLASDLRACSGTIAVGVSALLPGGTVLNSAQLLEADIRASCGSTATPTQPNSGSPPALPPTGRGRSTTSPALTVAGLLLVVGAATASASRLARPRVD